MVGIVEIPKTIITYEEKVDEAMDLKWMDTWCLNTNKLYNQNIAYVTKVNGHHMKAFKTSINDLKIFRILNQRQSAICKRSYICGSIFDNDDLLSFKQKFDLCNFERSRFAYHATHGTIAKRVVKIFVFGFSFLFLFDGLVSTRFGLTCEQSFWLFI